MFKRFNKNDSSKGATAAAPSLVPSAKSASANESTPSNPKPEAAEPTKKKVAPTRAKADLPDEKETRRIDRLLEIFNYCMIYRTPNVAEMP